MRENRKDKRGRREEEKKEMREKDKREWEWQQQRKREGGDTGEGGGDEEGGKGPFHQQVYLPPILRTHTAHHVSTFGAGSTINKQLLFPH